jgi:hypothetical protein
MADYEYAESYSASATKATIETDYDIYVPTTAKEISFILLPYVNGTSGKPVEADVTKATAAKFTIGSKPASSSSVAVVPTSSEDIVPTSSEDEEEP